MAPSNLQGLNIVHPPQPQNPYLSDQDLLAVPPFPDLSAQLDLWTNLNFQSDEPLVSRDDRRDSFEEKGKSSEKDSHRYNMPEEEMQDIGKIAETHAHENVVTGTVLPSTNGNSSNQPLLNLQSLPLQPPLDIGSLLSSFGIDPYQLPAVQAQPSQPAPSLAQLLSLHASSVRPNQLPAAPPPQQPSPLETSAVTPAPKRPRTARMSFSEQSEPASPMSPDADDKPNGTPGNAAEDKRRRNTAASARFRLKKKEREAALERKAKELENRVGELEKECEALRRENGWLKGLVVGVTGAGAVQQQQQQGASTSGAKRPREESDSALTA
ncbi:hypothetical protein QCA50_003839 [Cerrena zonata]|uniref:BZIP domain-containing protein n=1 Tax=Cerrena zonata TaxID=2478898 RepID=A0AAW0GSK3_9APHY